MNIGFRYFRVVHRWGLMMIPMCVLVLFSVASKAEQSLVDWLVLYSALVVLGFFGLFVEWPTRAGFSPEKKPWKVRGSDRDHQGL